MTKTWLLLMAGKGSLTDLREIWDPIKHLFNGLSAVYFGDRADEESFYLEAEKGEGIVVYLPYVSRHDLARNVSLHSGVIQQGDWCVVTDTLERPSLKFLTENLHPIADGSTPQHPNLYLFHNKPFLFQYHESMRYVGSPHETLMRDDQGMRALDLKNGYTNEADVRDNVRPKKRKDPFHFVEHFLRYMLFPWGSNHSLLGLEKNGDPAKLFPIRESRRLAFREEMRRRGFPLTVEGFKSMVGGELDDTLKQMIQSDKVWSDAYHYLVKGRTDVVCSHDDKDIIPLDSSPQAG